jgi:hypothetical protein
MAILTTHNLKQPAPVEPVKLNVITTSIIPEAPKVAPPIVGADLTKMITTHDEPPAAPGTDFTRDVDDMGKDKVEVKVGEPFDAKRAIDNLTIDLRHEPETKPSPAPKKKPGRKAKKD